MKQRAIIVIDLGFGDAGKGTITDFLCRQENSLVVRYNGGPQAAHNVVTPDGQHHTFSQFGSGTFAGAHTYLSSFMLINPANMLFEGDHLLELGQWDVWRRTWVDENCTIITPYQGAAGRIRELRRSNRHGSCGQGVGETQMDRLDDPDSCLYAYDLYDLDKARKKLLDIRARKQAEFGSVQPMSDAEQDEQDLLNDPDLPDAIIDTYRCFMERVQLQTRDRFLKMVRSFPQIVLEGAQGVLLDEWYGFHPYTTWSTTTWNNARALLKNFPGKVTTLGVTRAYQTRHGYGPMPTYSPFMSQILPDIENTTNQWQSDFRVGPLDIPLLRYATTVAGHIDALAITCIDRLSALTEPSYCVGYEVGDRVFERVPASHVKSLSRQEKLTKWLMTQVKPIYEPMDDPMVIGKLLHLPVEIVSMGRTANEKAFISS